MQTNALFRTHSWTWIKLQGTEFHFLFTSLSGSISRNIWVRNLSDQLVLRLWSSCLKPPPPYPEWLRLVKNEALWREHFWACLHWLHGSQCQRVAKCFQIWRHTRKSCEKVKFVLPETWEPFLSRDVSGVRTAFCLPTTWVWTLVLANNWGPHHVTNPVRKRPFA